MAAQAKTGVCALIKRLGLWLGLCLRAQGWQYKQQAHDQVLGRSDDRVQCPIHGFEFLGKVANGGLQNGGPAASISSYWSFIMLSSALDNILIRASPLFFEEEADDGVFMCGRLGVMAKGE